MFIGPPTQPLGNQRFSGRSV